MTSPDSSAESQFTPDQYDTIGKNLLRLATVFVQKEPFADLEGIKSAEIPPPPPNQPNERIFITYDTFSGNMVNPNENPENDSNYRRMELNIRRTAENGEKRVYFSGESTPEVIDRNDGNVYWRQIESSELITPGDKIMAESIARFNQRHGPGLHEEFRLIYES